MTSKTRKIVDKFIAEHKDTGFSIFDWEEIEDDIPEEDLDEAREKVEAILETETDE